MTAPKIIIIAGPNGAGKTTFAREFLPQEAHCPVFVNADLIAAGLSPFAPERAAIQAGRLMPWLRSRPCGASSACIRAKYVPSWPSPTCSNMPIELMASYGPSSTSR